MKSKTAVINNGLVHYQKKSFWRRFLNDYQLTLMLLPGLAYFIIFKYLPIYGIRIAFTNYKGGAMTNAKFVGFKWFIQFFNSYFFPRLLGNTLRISLLTLLFSFPVPIIFALLLNEVKCAPYKKVVQTVSYLPHFISTVVVISILRLALSTQSGVVNVLLMRSGRPQIDFFNESKWFLPMYIGTDVWQTFGWNSIIYFAALSNVDLQLYEASYIDGANRWQQLIHITLPCIVPTIIILLLMQLGKMMTVGYDKILLMYNPGIYDVSDVFSTYVYRRGILSADYGFSTAVDLFNSIANVIILLIFNTISRRTSEVSLW